MNSNSTTSGSGGGGSGFGEKIRGAFHAVHGIGENIRGTALGAVDTMTKDGTQNDEIAARGRMETTQGIEKIRGTSGSGGAYHSSEPASHPVGSVGDATIGNEASAGLRGDAGQLHQPQVRQDAIPDHPSDRPVPPKSNFASTTMAQDGSAMTGEQYSGHPATGSVPSAQGLGGFDPTTQGDRWVNQNIGSAAHPPPLPDRPREDGGRYT